MLLQLKIDYKMFLIKISIARNYTYSPFQNVSNFFNGFKFEVRRTKVINLLA